MVGINWILVKWGVVALGVLVAVWYVTAPFFAQKANEKAAAGVTSTLAIEKPKEAVATAKVEGKSNAKVQGLNAHSKAREARIIAGPDSDAEFYDGMCERELYKTDPQCSGRGSGERQGPTPG